jgi:hypothetical protein
MSTFEHVNIPHPSGYLAQCEGCLHGPCECGGEGTCQSVHCTTADGVRVVASFPIGKGWADALTEREMIEVDTDHPTECVAGSPGWTWHTIEGPALLIATAMDRLSRLGLLGQAQWYVGTRPAHGEWVGINVRPADIESSGHVRYEIGVRIRAGAS